MIQILMMPSKLATLRLLKIKVFRNKGYDIINSVHDVTNKNLFLNSGISVREVIITSILEEFDQKNQSF